MNCTRCGSEIPTGGSVCVQCGRKLYFTGGAPYYHMKSISTEAVGAVIRPSDPPKKAVIALLFSLFIAGAGQVYLGQIMKGILIFIATVTVAVVTMGTAALLVWVLAVTDAYAVGKKTERGKPVRKWEWF